MSAYIVSNNHLDVLVSYFVDYRSMYQLWTKINGEYGYLTKDNAKHLAYQLHKENVRSVDNRYNESNGDEMYQFTYRPHVRQAYHLGEIAGALDCLEHQSCERDDYYESDAWLNICHMRKNLLRKVAERELGDETTWEISQVKGKFAGAN